jgi:hypothetical protein
MSPKRNNRSAQNHDPNPLVGTAPEVNPNTARTRCFLSLTQVRRLHGGSADPQPARSWAPGLGNHAPGGLGPGRLPAGRPLEKQPPSPKLSPLFRVPSGKTSSQVRWPGRRGERKASVSPEAVTGSAAAGCQCLSTRESVSERSWLLYRNKNSKIYMANQETSGEASGV